MSSPFRLRRSLLFAASLMGASTLSLATAWASPSPPAVPPTPTSDDLAAIERSLATDAATTAANVPANRSPVMTTTPSAAGMSFNPDMAVILDVAAAAFSADATRQGGGHDPTRTGFALQQIEFALGKAVDPYFRFDTNLVFSPFGVEVEEAFATATALPGSLQARAGQFLTRFGRHNPTHLHAWDFLDQPFVMSRVFGGEGNRGAGFEVSWLTPLPWYVEAIGSATDAAGASTARSFWGGEDLGVSGPRDLQYTLALRQFFPISNDWSLLWGSSGAFGPNPTGHHNRSDIYGTDVYLKYRPLTAGSQTVVSLQAEALLRRRQIPGDALKDGGGYAQALYTFTSRWTVAARYEYGTPVWNRAGNETGADPDPVWAGHRHRWTTAVTFRPSEFSRLRVQASRDAISADASPIWAGMLALEVLAGAHGAHAF